MLKGSFMPGVRVCTRVAVKGLLGGAPRQGACLQLMAGCMERQRDMRPSSFWRWISRIIDIVTLVLWISTDGET